MTPERWNQCVRGLLLVRLGQELGTDGPLARAVHDFLDALIGLVR
jgi:hypothetical protein